MQRWDDLTPEEQQRYTDNEQLRALLAERTTALEQLQMALHVKHAQLTTVTADRDDYRAKFRDLEHELQMERGQVVAMQQRAEAAEARVKEQDAMLDMLPEYLDYWDACDGPALSLSEWWACKKNGYLQSRA